VDLEERVHRVVTREEYRWRRGADPKATALRGRLRQDSLAPADDRHSSDWRPPAVGAASLPALFFHLILAGFFELQGGGSLAHGLARALNQLLG